MYDGREWPVAHFIVIPWLGPTCACTSPVRRAWHGAVVLARAIALAGVNSQLCASAAGSDSRARANAAATARFLLPVRVSRAAKPMTARLPRGTAALESCAVESSRLLDCLTLDVHTQKRMTDGTPMASQCVGPTEAFDAAVPSLYQQCPAGVVNGATGELS